MGRLGEDTYISVNWINSDSNEVMNFHAHCVDKVSYTEYYKTFVMMC